VDLTHRMLLDLYGTVECESRWTTMLDQICADLGVRSAVAQVLERGDDRFAQLWTARDTGSLAQAALHDRCVNRPDNPRLDNKILAGSSDEIGSDLRLFGPSDPLHAVLRDRLRRSGLGDAIWATFPIADRRRFTLILHRHPGDEREVEETETRFLHMLLPHLKQAARLNAGFNRLRTRGRGLEATLEQLRAGIILSTGTLDVEWYNGAAAKILAASPLLRITDGQLWCRGHQDGRRLQALTAAVASGERHLATMAIGESCGAPIHVRIARVGEEGDAPYWNDLNPPVALFLSHATTAPHLDAAEIAALFSLTPAEARLAAALGSGTQLADFATARGISLGTARVQLKQVLAKTASGRQAELIRQLCGSVAAY